ncbi:hypothetical protein J437_LFUL000760 [Ladona fulva]|uniref:Uncharacterized protein n=1 Tax=Ladona fulva TaxID=123851 RepID=A0A8K0PBK3_LADFU|nr:hypothetical protein J437_LFUL000760 [Ladona fulva]
MGYNEKLGGNEKRHIQIRRREEIGYEEVCKHRQGGVGRDSERPFGSLGSPTSAMPAVGVAGEPTVIPVPAPATAPALTLPLRCCLLNEGGIKSAESVGGIRSPPLARQSKHL